MSFTRWLCVALTALTIAVGPGCQDSFSIDVDHPPVSENIGKAPIAVEQIYVPELLRYINSLKSELKKATAPPEQRQWLPS